MLIDSEKVQAALTLLARCCVAIDDNGAGWDDFYKEAMYEKGPLREDLDKAIADVRNGER